MVFSATNTDTYGLSGATNRVHPLFIDQNTPVGAASAPFTVTPGRDLVEGTSGNDSIRGLDGNDNLTGGSGNDSLWGEGQNDSLSGQSGHDLLVGGSGNDQLIGGDGRDRLYGAAGQDTLLGGSGDDVLSGGSGRDVMTGGAGGDRFVLQLAGGSSDPADADVITDFTAGEDRLQLSNNAVFGDVSIIAGTGSQAGNTLIQNRATGETLVILQGINSDSIDASDVLPVTSGRITALSTGSVVSVTSNTVKFGPNDSQSKLNSSGAAKITIGTQTIYIGSQQVSSINQNPIIKSFDSRNPQNNWVRRDYEVTGADGRGYGLFWSGTNLYAVFSVDGTQGQSSQDFRRVSGGATQSWLRSYGSGGGPKVAVLARLNPATGAMTEAVYLSAVLSSGKSNTLTVKNLSVNSSGNLVVNAQSYYSPRRPDGRAMTQTGSGGSPFNYTLTLTSNLKTVLSTSATGWR